ncbi:MAG TPA: D-alanyl-D-alanine carboxypeptidase [Rhodobacteraceae bacterium]|nr:D-alanyl-D-alanine carboxypeptidase [Paracoccaceae bacterium]
MSFAVQVQAAPRAELVMDMRTGKVIHSENADTRLHPASLTKMMTLYVAFEAVEHGEISLDTLVSITRHAASEPPSKLGLRPGQKIQLRYLIRAAAVKSANDAATAIGEAISGSEAAFARRMNRTAQALGMSRTHFKNAHGLTESGHLSTARDMTTLGRHLFFDYPDYYHLFKRRSIDIPGKTLPNTNRRFLAAYKGADGIKTGYTNAAGFNLVATAERGGRRVVATMFGGTSTQARNDRVAQLLDLGFANVPAQVATVRPRHPGYVGPGGKTIRLAGAPERSIRPRPKPGLVAPPEEVVVAIAQGIETVVEELAEAGAETATQPVIAAANTPPMPKPAVAEAGVIAGIVPSVLNEIANAAVDAVARDETATSAPEEPPHAGIILDTVEVAAADPEPGEVVNRISTSGGRHWGVTVGRFTTRDAADRMLIRTALAELASLGEALRKVVHGTKGFDANFVGLTHEGAELACRRLAARNTECAVFGPPS